MWDEGVEMAKTAYVLDEALESGDTGRIIELAELLSHQVKNEVSSQAEAEGWYEEYDRATSAEHWQVETTVDPFGPAAFPLKVVPAEETRERVTAGDSQKVSFDRNLIEKGLEQGVIHQVFGEGFTTTDTKMTVAIGEHYLIVPRQDSPADAITAQLEEMAGSDETYFKDKLAYIVSFLRENTFDVPTVSFESGLGAETYTLALYLDRYQSNDNLALAAIDVSEDSEDFGEQWGTLTVNLPNDPVAASWCAQDGNIVLDTNNTSQNLEDALVDAGVIEFTGEYVRSGFCSYPLATITPEAMSNLRGFRETADRILAERQEAEFQQAYDQDRDTGVSLKGEAETMRESASQLAGGDTSLKPDPER